MLIIGIAIAGALGALARWGLGLLMARWDPQLPFGTLTVNLLGCFLLGLVLGIAERASWMDGELRVVLTVGFIGTLTTFSTWQYETLRLARRGDVAWAAGNFAVNVVVGYALIWAGGWLAAQTWR